MDPEATEVAFAFWQVGPRLVCCGNFGSKVCQHCRKKSGGCEQNSPAALQTGKEEEMGLGTLHIIAPLTGLWVEENMTFLRASSAWPRGPLLPLVLGRVCESPYG